jgi:tetratricopeptide (TPR) repeat protein
MKEAGNKAFQAGDFPEAVGYFTEALDIDSTSALLRSNRSGAYASLGLHAEALADAEWCINLQPDWWKGFSRRGHAQYHLGRYAESEKSFAEALRLNPGDVKTTEALARARSQMATPPSGYVIGGGSGPLGASEESSTLRGAAGGDGPGNSAPAAPTPATAPEAPGKQAWGDEARRRDKRDPGAPPPSPGEKLLERRRQWLEEWATWDDHDLLKLLRRRGWDAEGFAREDIVEVLLKVETDRYHQRWCSTRGIQAAGLFVACVSIMGFFGGVTLWFSIAASSSANGAGSS